jgi:hypothetical protein
LISGFGRSRALRIENKAPSWCEGRYPLGFLAAEPLASGRNHGGWIQGSLLDLLKVLQDHDVVKPRFGITA